MEKGVPEKKQKSCEDCLYCNTTMNINPKNKKVTKEFTCQKVSNHYFILKDLKPCEMWYGSTILALRALAVVVSIVGLVVVWAFW